MTREKKLINSFILANVCDVCITFIALMLPGFTEKGFLAGTLFARAQVSEVLILKIAITAFMIGIYALAVHRDGRLLQPVQAALRTGNALVWFVVAWNELNVVLALSQML